MPHLAYAFVMQLFFLIICPAPVNAASIIRKIHLADVAIGLDGKSAPISVEIPDRFNNLKAMSGLIQVAGSNYYFYEVLFLEQFERFNYVENEAGRSISGVPGTGSVLVPNDPVIPFQSGTWKFQIVGNSIAAFGGLAKVDVDVILKYANENLSDRNYRGDLKLNFIVVDSPNSESSFGQYFDESKQNELVQNLSDFLRRPRFRNGEAYRAFLYNRFVRQDSDELFTFSLDGRSRTVHAENLEEIILEETLRYSREPSYLKDFGIDIAEFHFKNIFYSGDEFTKASVAKGGLNLLFREHANCEDCLNVFIVNSSVLNDKQVRGYSPGQPGHFGNLGGPSSGVVFFAYSQTNLHSIAKRIVHEVGHYLSLPHEEESNRFTDVDNRGANIMQTRGPGDEEWKWQASQGFTPQQMRIMLGHPLLTIH